MIQNKGFITFYRPKHDYCWLSWAIYSGMPNPESSHFFPPLMGCKQSEKPLTKYFRMIFIWQEMYSCFPLNMLHCYRGITNTEEQTIANCLIRHKTPKPWVLRCHLLSARVQADITILALRCLGFFLWPNCVENIMIHSMAFSSHPCTDKNSTDQYAVMPLL